MLVYVRRGAPLSTVLLRTLDVITIVVPPALPAAMTVGTVYAQARLRKRGIFCLSPARVNVCGKLKLICFDKTGTLTEEGLDLRGVVVAAEDSLLPLQTDITSLPPTSPTLLAMATCHSLITMSGSLAGDPLDLKMFEATGWQLEEPGETDNTKFDQLVSTVVRPPTCAPASLSLAGLDSGSLPREVGIVREFSFSSTTARMSVVVRELAGDHFTVYTKGAPERVVELCCPASVPAGFRTRLADLTGRGYRVIALASRTLQPRTNWLAVQKLRRAEVERDLHFAGLLVLQNSLKPETGPVMAELGGAGLRCLMVTGDNLLTAVSVGRDCGLLGRADRVVEAVAGTGSTGTSLTFREAGQDRGKEGEYSVVVQGRVTHIALTGRTWQAIRDDFPQLVGPLLARGTIFSRMSPDQKAGLVEQLQQLGYCVAMCGDGANDCGALKAAHVGVSLSEAEASVAAPFTSAIPNISCIPALIKEGRCALTTSFGVFRYMALYSIIQFISVLILYTNHTNLGDTQFLYIDLVITTTVAVLMGRTGPWERLVAKRPQGSLVSGKRKEVRDSFDKLCVQGTTCCRCCCRSSLAWRGSWWPCSTCRPSPGTSPRLTRGRSSPTSTPRYSPKHIVMILVILF